jgi:hypothetical protein
VLVHALAGLGLAFLVRASPLARVPVKPFTCRTCLSGWGAIIYGFATDPGALTSLERAAAVLALCFPAVGLAHLLYALGDGMVALVRLIEQRADPGIPDEAPHLPPPPVEELPSP